MNRYRFFKPQVAQLVGVTVIAQARAAASHTFVTEMQRFVSPPLIDAMLRESPPGKSWLEHAARTAATLIRHL